MQAILLAFLHAAIWDSLTALIVDPLKAGWFKSTGPSIRPMVTFGLPLEIPSMIVTLSDLMDPLFMIFLFYFFFSITLKVLLHRTY